MDSHSEEYKELVNKLAQEMLSLRMFNPLERPAYLVFEYFANISLRPTQFNKLEKFLKEKDLNLVMEMIMGSGKSKVLLPLLGLMRADGKDLSMIIVPQPLFFLQF
jgi:primosomal protein N'